MSVAYTDKAAWLQGVVGVKDAEPLLEWMMASDEVTLDLSECQHVHGAVLQLLMATRESLRYRIVAWPADPHLADWLKGALAA